MTSPVQGSEPTTDTAPNDPPYKNYLDEIPEALRPQVEETFKKWDADVTNRFQSLHSEYDPYKTVIDEYDPDALSQAVGLVNFMNENPEEFLRQYIQATGVSPEQGTAVTAPVTQTTPQQTAPTGDDPYAAKYEALEQSVTQIVQLLQGQQQQTAQQQGQQQLQAVLDGLHTKHGDFDDVVVLSYMANGMGADESVNQFKNILGKYGVSANATAPTVVSGANGGHAVEQISAADLASGKVNSKDLVVQMLKNAAEQG